MLVKSAAATTGDVTGDRPDRRSPASGAPSRSAVSSRVIKDPRPGLTIERYFTRQGVDPFDTVDWELRDAVIGDLERAARLLE